jgi:tRNA dimethylallyltransferase
LEGRVSNAASTDSVVPVGALLAIVGPTASGKTALAIELAQRHGGEIICADSRTIYRGLNIGTAKPTLAEQAAVPHHLLDILEPNQPYSAALFKQAAESAIAEIRARHHLPILVGGTGLYVDAVLYDYQFPAGASSSLRHELEQLPQTELVERLQRLDPEIAATIDLRNPRRVIRALELVGQPRIAPRALPPTTYIIGLDPGMEELERRIATRTRQMLAAGLVDEVRGLTARYSAMLEPFNTAKPSATSRVTSPRPSWHPSLTCIPVSWLSAS